jgi:prepilin peptidase CpaA
MEHPDLQFVAHGALTLYVLLLCTAAATDMWKFIIPNWVSAALLLLFVSTALLVPAEIDWLSHAGAGLSVFAVGVGLFALGWLGAGDVKLMAAVALWAGFGNLAHFVFIVALAGGGLALLLLGLRVVIARLPALRAVAQGGRLPRILAKGEKVPYGVAIACGAIVLGFQLPYLDLGFAA